MTDICPQEVEVDHLIQEVLEKSISRKAKRAEIQEIKRFSMAHQPKASSFKTVLNIANSMVGSSTLVFPVLFYESGIMLSVVISIIIGLISCKTTKVLVTHNQSNELDLPDTIFRILGPKWMKAFNISNVILLWASGLVFMILICKQLYPIISLIANSMGIDTAEQDSFTFAQLSYQWIGVIFIVCIFPVLVQRNLQTILKLTPYGTISILIYLLFTMYMAIDNLTNNYDTMFDNLIWFSLDIRTLAGAFGMAFIAQSLIIPIVKNNANQDKNNRDIGFGFLWTWTIYTVAGVCGSLAIAGKSPREGTPGTILLEYFSNTNVAVIIIQILMFMQLSLVYPVLQFVTRSQFFQMIHDVDKTPAWQFYAFTAFYAGTCLIVQCLEVNVQLIISLCGALIGLLQEYIIPVAIHFTCLYAKNAKVMDRQQIRTAYDASIISDHGTNAAQLIPLQIEEKPCIQCNDHMEIKEKYSKLQRSIMYSSLLCVGFTIAVGMVLKLLNI